MSKTSNVSDQPNELQRESDGRKDYALRMLCLITDADKAESVAKLLKRRHLSLLHRFHADGTANSDMLNVFGLGGTAKMLTACVVPGFIMEDVLVETARELRLESPGKGIAFTVPLSGIVGNAMSAINDELSDDIKDIAGKIQLRMEEMRANMEKIKNSSVYCMVVASVNQGFSEVAATAAHEAGARGGTTWTARAAEFDRSFGPLRMAFPSEREILVIITPKEKKLDIMKAINAVCGIKTEAQGIVLSLPVDYVMGLRT